MKTKWIYIAALSAGLVSLSSCNSTAGLTESPNYKTLSPFGASYEKIDSNLITDYDLIIVEPDHYNKNEVAALRSTGARILAYISVGEVSAYRWYFSRMKARGFLGRNEIWDSYYINLADPVVFALFFDEIIPRIMSHKYDGFFLDTIDAAAPYTTRNHLEPEMVRFIRQLRNAYPKATIIQNAGLFILGHTASSVDAVLIEDIATNYDFTAQAYQLREEESYRDRVQTIQSMSESHGVPFLIIDFAESDALRARVSKRLDGLEYPYFINTIELNTIATGITGNNY